MTDMSEIKEYLKKTLSIKRYEHSLGTADEAKKLAKRYGADEYKAYLAGLVHDCAKEIDVASAAKMLKEKYGTDIDQVMLHMPGLLHGPLGACIAKECFEIDDAEVLTAIKYHTTGAANMTLLQKIIYIADYIEPGRDYKGVDKLRDTAYHDIDKAILEGINYTICKLIKNKQPIHLDTVSCRNTILMEKENL